MQGENFILAKVLLENGWNSKEMITEGEAAIPLETTLNAYRNQEKTKQRSTIRCYKFLGNYGEYFGHFH